MKNVIVVANFNAGRKRAVRYKKRIMSFLFKHAENFRFTTVEDLPSQNFDNVDTIMVVGGDGTLNGVLPYAEGRTIALIPSGTANLFASKLGISENLNKALKTVQEGCVREFDLIDVNGRPCVLRCGFGYDSNIICHTPQSLKNRFGYFAYFVAGILYGFRLKKRAYTITLNGETGQVGASCIIVANSANMFKNLVSVGNSELSDGRFELFILKVQNPILFFIEFLKILFGIKLNTAYAQFLHTDRFEVKSSYLNYHVDGEGRKSSESLVFTISPQKIKIYSPN